MAFSYSDKNFTVIGNLCFAHIVQSANATYAIPPAISDRMLLDEFYCVYVGKDAQPSFAQFKLGKIRCNGSGYLNCYFPIDSNK